MSWRGQAVPDPSTSVATMCGRFTSLTPPEELAAMFRADVVDDVRAETFEPNFNVAPSTKILTVAHSPSQGRVIGRLRWGLIPEWAKDSHGTGQINARSETVAEKPTFRDSFRKRRCLIPMSGYYEWRTVGDDTVHPPSAGSASGRPVKRAVYVTRRDGRPLAAAGLWASWSDRSEDPETGHPTLKSCCILTADSTGELAAVHDRMPVFLDEHDWPLWLGETAGGDDVRPQLLEILAVSRRVDDLRFVDVGPEVNSIRNNGPDLIAPIR